MEEEGYIDFKIPGKCLNPSFNGIWSWSSDLKELIELLDLS